MQVSFKRNLILVFEAVLAFIFLQVIEFYMNSLSPILLGLIVLLFSLVFFVTTYLFVKVRDKKLKYLNLSVQTELAN
jgi:hypothetical protein